MSLSSVHIAPEALSTNIAVKTKNELFDLLGSRAHNVYGADKLEVISGLTERERLGSTGFGGSVAIPHTKIQGLGKSVAIVLGLAAPINFEAHDGRPVDIIFGLLSPKNGGAEHLKALAEISRLLRDDDFVAKLRGAANADSLYVMLTGNRGLRAA